MTASGARWLEALVMAFVYVGLGALVILCLAMLAGAGWLVWAYWRRGRSTTNREPR